MSTYIHSIATTNPPYKQVQQEVREFMKTQFPEGSMAQRVVHKVYASSGIETRYSVIADLHEENPEFPFFHKESDGSITLPDTKLRNDYYTRFARPLLKDACSKALAKSSYSNENITHVITVSCTGFFAPGPDYYLVRDLGLSKSTQRFHIGFMGCYAAFTALRLADSICSSNPDAVVLIGDIELCTLHLQFKQETDSIVSGSVFGDGAAGVIVSAKKPEKGLLIKALETIITEEGEEDMAWTIGNNGFDMVLSSYVPKILGAEISNVILPFLEKNNIPKSSIQEWAIHPGGKAILDKCEQALELRPEQLQTARNVLNDVGNMSSVTILFILERIMQQQKDVNTTFPAMAFGPGLTVEFGLFEKV